MHMIGGCAIMGMCVVWGLTASGDVLYRCNSGKGFLPPKSQIESQIQTPPVSGAMRVFAID